MCQRASVRRRFFFLSREWSFDICSAYSSSLHNPLQQPAVLAVLPLAVAKVCDLDYGHEELLQIWAYVG